MSVGGSTIDEDSRLVAHMRAAGRWSRARFGVLYHDTNFKKLDGRLVIVSLKRPLLYDQQQQQEERGMESVSSPCSIGV